MSLIFLIWIQFGPIINQIHSHFSIFSEQVKEKISPSWTNFKIKSLIKSFKSKGIKLNHFLKLEDLIEPFDNKRNKLNLKNKLED